MNAVPGGSTARSSSRASGTERRCGVCGSEPSPKSATIARSTSPRSSAGTFSAGSSSASWTVMPGCARSTSAAASITNARIALVNAETRTVPAGASRSARSASSAASMRSRITRAWPASATPASVSATVRPWRSSRAAPLSRSSAASCCETADGLIDAALATARTVPRLSSWISRRRRRGSSTVKHDCTASDRKCRWTFTVARASFGVMSVLAETGLDPAFWSDVDRHVIRYNPVLGTGDRRARRGQRALHERRARADRLHLGPDELDPRPLAPGDHGHDPRGGGHAGPPVQRHAVAAGRRALAAARREPSGRR